MIFDLNSAIENFKGIAQLVFEFYRSVYFTIGTKNVNMFDILLFFMIITVIWQFLTGDGGDDD